MKTVNKIIVSCSCIVFFMLLLPLIVIKFSDVYVDMGSMILLFFVVYPVMSMALGMVAGTDIRRMWWLPLAEAAVFPFLFAVAIGELVFELYVYSALYIMWGGFFMGVTVFVKRTIKKITEKRNEKH